MPLGYDRELNVVNAGDTAELNVSVLDVFDSPHSSTDIGSVQFIVQRPDDTKQTLVGVVEEDGTGSLRYTDTLQIGHYAAVASFALLTGEIKSVRTDFEVVDPFDPPTPSNTQIVADTTWRKLEDCFDSEEGGPWLRDMTLAFFTKEKIPVFVPEALFDINVTNPLTNVNLDYFAADAGDGTRPQLPLLVQGTYLQVIKHLMASYVEQPQPEGGQIAWQDRRDYLQRWGTIFQIEFSTYDHWVKLWKRQFLGLGHSKLLVGSKAGRLIPAPMRTRYVGRGFQ